MRRTCKEKGIWVYVFRDTIEKGYLGEDNLAKILVKEDWLERYVVQTSKYGDLSNWLDFYIADETVDLYDKAKEAGAVLKVDFGKPVVVENNIERDSLSLAFEAMRILEITGKHDEASEMYDKITGFCKKYTYLEARKLVKKYIDVELRKDRSMIRVGTSLNVYSELNPWIDFIVNVGAYVDVEKTQEIIEQAFSEWFEDNEEVGNSTIIEYISEKLKAENIDFEIYVKMEEAEEV